MKNNIVVILQINLYHQSKSFFHCYKRIGKSTVI